MADSAERPISATRLAVYIAVAIALGGVVAVQTRVNGELGDRLGDGYAAALISFATGWLVLLAITAFSPPIRRGLTQVRRALMTRSIPWWYVMGGLAGALVVLGQGLTAAVIGVALFSISIVAGQTIGSLLIDRRGVGTMQPKAVTVPRVLGSALALVAVGVTVATELQGNIPVWMLVLPFIAGIGTGLQQAVNGQVRHVAGSALAATVINFSVGLSALIVVFVVHAALTGWPSELPTDAWLYLGGVSGILFIAGFSALVRATGVLVLGLAAIAGQLIASVALDLFAPVGGRALTVTTLVATLVALVAVGIATIPQRRPTAPK